MAVRHVTRGRLIAIEGNCGPIVAASAKSLVRALRSAHGQGGVSAWDSSGIFTELAAAETGIPGASARALTLLYAADLAFRRRWQIEPALEAGVSVVAAPYIESAKALGVAAGLPKRWLDELFRFAPKPDVCYRIKERATSARAPSRGWGPAPLNKERGGRKGSSGQEGYSEFFACALAGSGDAIDPARVRSRSIEYLTSLEGRGRCQLFTAQAAATLRGK
jgi:thymidylate kinase